MASNIQLKKAVADTPSDPVARDPALGLLAVFGEDREVARQYVEDVRAAQAENLAARKEAEDAQVRARALIAEADAVIQRARDAAASLAMAKSEHERLVREFEARRMVVEAADAEKQSEIDAELVRLNGIETSLVLRERDINDRSAVVAEKEDRAEKRERLLRDARTAIAAAVERLSMAW